MSVNVVNVQVLQNPSTFDSPFSLKVMFECLRPISEVQFKLIYVGSPIDESCDQILECLEIGPLQPGLMQFTLEAQHPDAAKIQIDQLLKLTAIILTSSYNGQQFFRLGYYVHYQHPEIQEPYTLEDLDLASVQRHILSDKPRITKTPIEWTSPSEKQSSKDSISEVLSTNSSKIQHQN